MKLDKKTIIAFVFLLGACTLVVRNLIGDAPPVYAGPEEAPVDPDEDVMGDGGATGGESVARSHIDFIGEYGSYSQDQPVANAFGVLDNVLEGMQPPESEVVPEAAVEVVQAQPPTHMLQLVMRTEVSSRAVVDYRVLGVGDMVEAGEVVEILPQAIRVRGRHGVLEYELGGASPRVIEPPAVAPLDDGIPEAKALEATDTRAVGDAGAGDSQEPAQEPAQETQETGDVPEGT